MSGSRFLLARPAWAALAAGLVLSLLAAAWRLIIASAFSWPISVLSGLLFAGILIFACLSLPHSSVTGAIVWPWVGLTGAIILVLAAAGYLLTDSPWCALLSLTLFWALLLDIEVIVSDEHGLVVRWLARLVLASLAAAVPVAIVQVRARFAEEEFFVALQALTLGVAWLGLSIANLFLGRVRTAQRANGLLVRVRVLVIAISVLCLAGALYTVRAYQHSFYPPEGPSYPGISEEQPFLCSAAARTASADSGEDVFRRLLARVAANPAKGPAEFGMLALGDGGQQWAIAFRDAVLAEAETNAFANPAGSMKSIQYDAALRAYYYPRVRAAFPELFSGKDQAVLAAWFAAINRRAETVEPVDWLYALAFAKKPEGPYENQEIGAGLLALLESEQLADPASSSANQAYLDRTRRGWDVRFRNTDDAYTYQITWLQNAYFQSLYTRHTSDSRIRLSLDWLLDQALPDGAPLRYNHPSYYSLAGIAYAAAVWLDDPQYLWLAARAIEVAERTGSPVFAQPGAERPVTRDSSAPQAGSCLLYGGSGLPNQSGPLAPDKIVFRDGWGPDASYLLLNLRFAGWHRYKATNTVTSVYQAGQLSGDTLSGQRFTWLPEGRSLFRDKRIPRENLNGLLIARTGLDAILQAFTGVGSQWAQDPLHYARVVAFETGADVDQSHTSLEAWHGWRHDRTVYFYHGGGPIIIADEVKGPVGGRARLVWQTDVQGAVQQDRLHLRNEPDPAEAVFQFVRTSGGETPSQEVQKEAQSVFYEVEDGFAQTITVFLLKDWVGAEVTLSDDGNELRIAKGDKHVELGLTWEKSKG